MKTKYYAILRDLRSKSGYTQSEIAKMLLGLDISATPTQVSRWENGHNNPTIEQFIGLCGIFGIDNVYRTFGRDDISHSEYFLNDEGKQKLNDYRRLLFASKMYSPVADGDNHVIRIKRRTVPFYDVGASAGTGQFLDSNSYEMVEVPDYVPETATFGLHVAGDSMEPTLEDGQQIWVHMQPTLTSGDIGVFYLDGCAFVKEYSITDDGVFLISHNAAYEPIRVTEENEARIYGKVVYPHS